MHEGLPQGATQSSYDFRPVEALVGRCAAVEILIGSSALASMIREGKISQISSLIQTGSAVGMQAMDNNLMKLVREEKITKEAAYEKAIEKQLFV